MGICVTLALTVLSFLGRSSFFAEICTHFVNLYALAGLAGTLLVTPARQWRWAAVCLAVFLVNGARVAGLYFPTAYALEDTASLTVVSANLLSENRDRDRAIAWLREADADVLMLQEVTDAWWTDLQAAFPKYAHMAVETRGDNFGIAVMSRIPLEDVAIARFGDNDIPAVTGTVVTEAGGLRFVNLHTMPPGNAWGLALRNAQMNEAAASIASGDEPGFVVGDFNCSPWSPYFHDLLREHDLRDARRGHGVLATWPSFANPFMIPIDQCLTTSGAYVTDLDRGPNLGSDHLPLRLELAVSAD